MRILYLSYWGLNDPLTVATCFPNLQLLQERPEVSSILLVTVEREATTPQLRLPFDAPNISYQALHSPPGRGVMATKVDDFIRFPRELTAMVQAHRIDLVVARGAPAGALAYLLWQKTRTRFVVESFEPHADYMLESGVWRRYDPRFLFQRYWERRQKQLAHGLMPVAENYRRQLLKEGVPASRIVTVPCFVDLQKFQFDTAQRQLRRQQLGIPEDAVVGVYVGKFGDMYYQQEAFDIFRACQDHFGPAFRLIVLTGANPDGIRANLQKVGVNPDNATVVGVAHHEVPAYLSASDFAFATAKPIPSRQHCSLVKVGEYWANGLPVLLTKGVGDESEIVDQEFGGAIFELADRQGRYDLKAALGRISELLAKPDYRQHIRQLALHYRSDDTARHAYEVFVGGK